MARPFVQHDGERWVAVETLDLAFPQVEEVRARDVDLCSRWLDHAGGRFHRAAKGSLNGQLDGEDVAQDIDPVKFAVNIGKHLCEGGYRNFQILASIGRFTAGSAAGMCSAAYGTVALHPAPLPRTCRLPNSHIDPIPRMSGLKFTNTTADRLEALYRTADVVAQRSETLSRLHLAKGESVIDLGSGPGLLCESMADIVGPSGRVFGIDISADLVARAERRNHRTWLCYRVRDAVDIDEPDATFDVATCTQVAEYIADVDRAIAETFRVLKRGGRALFIATDWDGVIWNSDAPARMAAVMKSWEAHCAHPRLPRTLARRLRDAGFVLGAASVFPILNLEWTDAGYSKGTARIIAEFVARRGDVREDDVKAWSDEFPRLSDEGRYFFSMSRFIFNATKPS